VISGGKKKVWNQAQSVCEWAKEGGREGSHARHRHRHGHDPVTSAPTLRGGSGKGERRSSQCQVHICSHVL
jgi:hypothetical protein